jgi:hypothetical protein
MAHLASSRACSRDDGGDSEVHRRRRTALLERGRTLGHLRVATLLDEPLRATAVGVGWPPSKPGKFPFATPICHH